MKRTIICVVALVVMATACKKKEEVLSGDAAVNTRILEQMRTWYLWDDKIPASPNLNQAPDKFFESLLYRYDANTRPDGDRFSWIDPSAKNLQASLSGESKTTGAEYQLYIKNNSNDLAARILYTNAGSPAEKAGLLRGDIVTKITVDGRVVTKDNYGTLMSTGTSYEFEMGSYTNGTWMPGSTTKKSEAVVFQKNPIYMDSVYTIGTKKIGYFVYHQFVPAPNGSTVNTYNQNMDKIFAKFQRAGINELVLDFRYNPGGYVSASTNLASLVVRNGGSSKVFTKRQYNPTIAAAYKKQYGDNFADDKFLDKAENVGNNLTRVFVLTSKRSASASELVINGLKPFMDVIVIGDVTTGKNVGSITITDTKNRYDWGLQPIVMRSANANGQSDYTSGFKPLVTVIEALGAPMPPFGDYREPLLNEAIFQITGNRTARRGSVYEAGPAPLATSFEHNAGSGLIIELK